ncbi:PadR family transcriptional regulator PadR [Natronospira proteinivora]|uniref:PadR family transcriptional regulator PadR n=1 Tax=Natronospira proteinivora TaxID=1807133 RepID=A0ABT1GAX1_9GAMM|nr:PadR family transcriptional regulator [Natronospira proteinivora]MCP1727403.1 PadR family transcriptional regulator PadR [Natronospira proteinivora]
MMKKQNASDGQILKGLLDTLVLDVLSNEPDYGFGIRQQLQLRLGEDAGLVKEATLYPLLHRLEARGLLDSYREPGSRGSPRKYYRLTTDGEAFLAGRIVEWRRIAALLERTVLRSGSEPSREDEK